MKGDPTAAVLMTVAQTANVFNQNSSFAEMISKYGIIIEDCRNRASRSFPTFNSTLLNIFDAIVKETVSLLQRGQLNDEDTRVRVEHFINDVWSMCVGTFTVKSAAHNNTLWTPPPSKPSPQ